VQVPLFLSRQIFVNFEPGVNVELSGTVTSLTKVMRSQPRLGVGVRVKNGVRVGVNVLVGVTVGVRDGVCEGVMLGVNVCEGEAVAVNV
jgi:hypothetical protein